ncbi:TraB family protein [Roseovarius sp. THAF9]|uniref:TraB/GumN family protein n=1 Tax=Roseovarius sp. THAF9 TaxID=2587847 RepID=UPI0012A98214|nr:TraB/GumN family protein [Roseovarius sp. THAF9]QFT94119.1 TraB family protein [Roseovarius sp. THAF9]
MKTFRIALLAPLCFALGFALPAAAQETQGNNCGGADLIDALDPGTRKKLEREAAAMPHSEGIQWQAKRGDTVIDIFGTYHFEHRLTDAHLQRLEPIITAADKIYLEISNDDQMAMQRAMAENPSLMFITEGPTLPDLLGEEDWQQYREEMQARMIPGFMAAKFKPLWAGMMLGIGPCEAQAGAFEAKGIDMLVGDRAAEVGNPSRSLEEFDALLTLLDSFPMDDQIEMIRMSLAWPGDMNDLSYTIRERYLSEEIAMTLVFSRYVSEEYGGEAGAEGFAMVEDLLLEKRNLGWIDRLEAQVAPGDHVLIAVGAGHLPGEVGILKLLEDKGYTVTRMEQL